MKATETRRKLLRTLLSKHAMNQLRSRTRLSIEELFVIIDNNKYVPVGRDGHKIHKLFYSLPDSRWFIAVQDECNGEIITLLTQNFHNRWNIDGKGYIEARKLVDESWVKEFESVEQPEPQLSRKAKKMPEGWHFWGSVIAEDGSYFMSYIGFQPADRCGDVRMHPLDSTIYDELWQKLTERVQGRGAPSRIHANVRRKSGKGSIMVSRSS